MEKKKEIERKKKSKKTKSQKKRDEVKVERVEGLLFLSIFGVGLQIHHQESFFFFLSFSIGEDSRFRRPFLLFLSGWVSFLFVRAQGGRERATGSEERNEISIKILSQLFHTFFASPHKRDTTRPLAQSQQKDETLHPSVDSVLLHSCAEHCGSVCWLYQRHHMDPSTF
jgi:hypothetical protein